MKRLTVFSNSRMNGVLVVALYQAKKYTRTREHLAKFNLLAKALHQKS